MKLPPLLCLLAVLIVAPSVAVGDPGKGGARGLGHGNGPPAPPPGQSGDSPGPPPEPPAPDPNAVLSPEGLVTVGADQNVALDAVRAGLALPLDHLLAVASGDWGGRIIDAKLLKSNRGFLYRLTVLTDAGVARRVFVDARTGRTLAAP